MSYVRTADFVTAGSARRSATMNRELDLIAAALAGVDTDIAALLALKANLASPTFTGVPAGPTASVGTNTTQLATTAFVITQLGAIGAVPPMATNAGKFLYTDGSVASWQFLPPSIGGGGYQAVTASATVSKDVRFLDVTATTVGLTMTLPDATTMQEGDGFAVNFAAATGAETQGIRDSTGELRYAFDGAEDSLDLVLTDNATAAGTWKTRSLNGAGFDALPAIPKLRGSLTTFASGSSQPFTLALGSDQFIQVCHSSSLLRAFVITASHVDFTKHAEVTVSEAAAPVWCQMLAVTGGFVYVYLTSLTSGAIKAVAITVSGTTASIGTPVTLIASAADTKVNAIHAAASGAAAVVAARTAATTLETVACSITGTTVNAGTAITAITATDFGATDTQVRIVCYDTNKFLVSTMTDNGASDGELHSRVVELATLTLTTPGSTTVYTGVAGHGVGDIACAVATTSSVLICQRKATGALYGRIASISGSAVTLPVPTSLSAVAGTATSISLVSISSTLFVCGVGSSSGGGGFVVTVSGGTTVALGASSIAGSTAVGSTQPVYDGTYVALGEMGLYTVSPSTLTQVMAWGDITDNGGDIHQPVAFRLSYLKSYAFFEGRGDILRYGGVA